MEIYVGTNDIKREIILIEVQKDIDKIFDILSDLINNCTA